MADEHLLWACDVLVASRAVPHDLCGQIVDALVPAVPEGGQDPVPPRLRARILLRGLTASLEAGGWHTPEGMERMADVHSQLEALAALCAQTGELDLLASSATVAPPPGLVMDVGTEKVVGLLRAFPDASFKEVMDNVQYYFPEWACTGDQLMAQRRRQLIDAAQSPGVRPSVVDAYPLRPLLRKLHAYAERAWEGLGLTLLQAMRVGEGCNGAQAARQQTQLPAQAQREQQCELRHSRQREQQQQPSPPWPQQQQPEQLKAQQQPAELQVQQPEDHEFPQPKEEPAGELDDQEETPPSASRPQLRSTAAKAAREQAAGCLGPLLEAAQAATNGTREPASGGKRRKPVRWTTAEVDKLVEYCKQFGSGSWAEVKKHDSEQPEPVLGQRTQVDLKDKWRNMVKNGRITSPDQDEVRYSERRRRHSHPKRKGRPPHGGGARAKANGEGQEEEEDAIEEGSEGEEGDGGAAAAETEAALAQVDAEEAAAQEAEQQEAWRRRAMGLADDDDEQETGGEEEEEEAERVGARRTRAAAAAAVEAALVRKKASEATARPQEKKGGGAKRQRRGCKGDLVVHSASKGSGLHVDVDEEGEE